MHMPRAMALAQPGFSRPHASLDARVSGGTETRVFGDTFNCTSSYFDGFQTYLQQPRPFASFGPNFTGCSFRVAYCLLMQAAVRDTW
jgi:hypothetical protein